MDCDKSVQLLPPIPFSMIICGSSMSGKSTFLNTLLKDWHSMYPSDTVRKVVLVHKFSEQPAYTELLDHFGKDKILMTKDFNSDILSSESIGDASDGTCIVILDDVLQEIASNTLLTELVVGGTHHLRICTFIVCHNLYANRHPNWITVSRNVGMLAILQCPRDMAVLSHLNRQLFPGKGRQNYVIDACKMAQRDQLHYNKNRFSHLLIDCSIDCPHQYRLRTGIGPNQHKFCYVTPD